MRTSSRIAIVVLVCCAVAFVVMLCRPSNVPDTQQIGDQLASAVQGANQHSIGRIMGILSSDYHDYNQMGSDGIRYALSSAMRNAPSFSVTDTQPVIDITGNTATSQSTLTIRIQGDSGPIQISRPISLRWKKEQAYRLLLFPTTVWRVISADYGAVNSVS
jgi:hypothetical protein